MTMSYLGIDQHARQITISLRDEIGDVVQARQVSTQPEKTNALFNSSLANGCTERCQIVPQQIQTRNVAGSSRAEHQQN